jgi:glycolate oxidase
MKLIKELQKNLPKDIIQTSDNPNNNLGVFECDGLSIIKHKPKVVALPKTLEQVQTIIKICKKYNTAIIPRGAGTGLTGGATATGRNYDNELILGFSRMNKILKIDTKNKSATLQPGVVNAQISAAVSEFGLYYAPDPSSQIACTIGGNVAENSGGVHCLKYGLTVHNIISLKYLDTCGEIIELHKDNDNMGLMSLLIGSEGLLGLVVEVCVKLLKKPENSILVMAGFESVSDCANAVGDVIKAGVIPAGLEMMDGFAIDAAEDFAKAGYPKVPALLLCELDGNSLDVESDKNAVLKVFAKASSIKIAESEAERLLLWKGRKSAFPAVGRLSPDYYCMDGTIPKRHLATILEKIAELSKKYNLRVANVFHAGDGNLHPLILYNGNNGETNKAEEFGEDILKACVDVGGTITGEHGVGLEKLNAMCYQFNAEELEIFHKIKSVFDEGKLFNPGKAIPELHRCAETGKMHIHNNNVPFPKLDRF